MLKPIKAINRIDDYRAIWVLVCSSALFTMIDKFTKYNTCKNLNGFTKKSSKYSYRLQKGVKIKKK